MSLFHISQGFTDGDEMYKSVWQQQEVKGKMFQSVLGRQTMPSVIAEGTKSSISSELPLVKRVLLFVTCVIEKKKIVYCCSKFTFPCPIRYFLIWIAQSGANPACSVTFLAAVFVFCGPLTVCVLHCWHRTVSAYAGLSTVQTAACWVPLYIGYSAGVLGQSSRAWLNTTWSQLPAGHIIQMHSEQ